MLINKLDNVDINLEDGHKYALRDIKCGEDIIKYGNPIGHATCDIKQGEHVHTHNVKTNLSGNLEYTYEPKFYDTPVVPTDRTFMGYVRENGDVGIRNEIWIVNTVGCVNKIAEKIATRTGARYFPHPFGCSQLGDDQTVTQLILRGMVNHPNAAGVLVLGLGCENNNIDVFKKVLGEYNPDRVKFLNTQDYDDDVEAGVAVVNELKSFASDAVKEIDERISIHDFRAVIGETHTNIIFDIVLPFESELTPKKIKELICEKIKSKRSYVNCVITVDRG